MILESAGGKIVTSLKGMSAKEVIVIVENQNACKPIDMIKKKGFRIYDRKQVYKWCCLQ